jgi:hypothetical protein
VSNARRADVVGAVTSLPSGRAVRLIQPALRLRLDVTAILSKRENPWI